MQEPGGPQQELKIAPRGESECVFWDKKVKFAKQIKARKDISHKRRVYRSHVEKLRINISRRCIMAPEHEDYANRDVEQAPRRQVHPGATRHKSYDFDRGGGLLLGDDFESLRTERGQLRV